MSADKVLLVKGRAGLGNRMLVVASAIVYARLSGRRLIVDWRDGLYANPGVEAFEQLFSCPANHPIASLPRGGSVAPALWRDILDQSTLDLADPALDNRTSISLQSIDPTKLDYPEDIAVFWHFTQVIDVMKPLLSGDLARFREAPLSHILRALLREELTPHPDVLARIDAYQRRLFAGTMVGVHVRFTDHRANLIGLLGQVDAVLARQPGARIFLATDNVEVLRLFEHVYGDVVSIPHWYPEAGRRQHEFVRGVDPLESAIDALVDMYLLARCDWLIMDRSSSFGRIAMLVGDHPKERVLDVRARGKSGVAARSRSWWWWQRLGFFTYGMRAFARAYKLARDLRARAARLG